MAPLKRSWHRVLVKDGAGPDPLRRRRQLGPFTERTGERRAEPLVAALRGEDPLAGLERRPVTDVLAVPATELSDPVPFIVTPVPDDGSVHKTRVPLDSDLAGRGHSATSLLPAEPSGSSIEPERLGSFEGSDWRDRAARRAPSSAETPLGADTRGQPVAEWAMAH